MTRDALHQVARVYMIVALLFLPLVAIGYAAIDLLPDSDAAWFGLYVLGFALVGLGSLPTGLAVTSKAEKAERLRAYKIARNSWQEALGATLGFTLIGAGAGASEAGLLGAVAGAAIGFLVVAPLLAIFLAMRLRPTRERLRAAGPPSRELLRAAVVLGYLWFFILAAYVGAALYIFTRHA